MYKIYEVDHLPHHCHVFFIRGREYKVNFLTLEVLKPRNAKLTAKARKCIREHREEMLLAWDEVEIIDEED